LRVAFSAGIPSDPDAALRARAVATMRKAFAGLTPGVIAIIAGLLVLRILNTNIDEVLLDPETVRRYYNGVYAESWIVRALAGLSWLLIMAVPIVLAVFATSNLGPQHGVRRIAALSAAVVVSTGFGILVRMCVQEWVFGLDRFGSVGQWLPMLWVRYAAIAAVLTAAGEFIRRENAHVAATRRAEMDAARFDREMTEARLQLVLAQVEPHFLFNTLANLRRLSRSDAAAGRDMLDNLMRYFEVALPRIRDGDSTLAQDALLIDAYLRLHQVRMAERLRYEIDIPPEVADQAIPSMMLLTLVENAIKHGLNPLPDGGFIGIAARATGGRLAVSVADTGAGFSRDAGKGAGLANIRTRLALLFGGDATLAIEPNKPTGCVVTLLLPLVAKPTPKLAVQGSAS
jgi:signal transduction histidine kinase